MGEYLTCVVKMIKKGYYVNLTSQLLYYLSFWNINGTVRKPYFLNLNIGVFLSVLVFSFSVNSLSVYIFYFVMHSLHFYIFCLCISFHKYNFSVFVSFYLFFIYFSSLLDNLHLVYILSLCLFSFCVYFFFIFVSFVWVSFLSLRLLLGYIPFTYFHIFFICILINVLFLFMFLLYLLLLSIYLFLNVF